MAGQEPKELVSCGKCNSINSVPFGLDRFKCYNCGVSVVISRESSSACAAASPTALYLDSMQGEGGSSSSRSKKTEAEKSGGSSGSSRGFFDRLTRQVDKTLQKVEQSLFDGSAAPKPTPAEKLHVGEPPAGEMPKRAAEAQAAGYPKAPPEPDLASQLKAAEDKAFHLEQLLESATAREAVSSSERRVLRKQLDESEQLVSGLSQQLDSVQAEVAEQRRQCEALEKALEEATRPHEQGTELQRRIAELEAELQSLRHATKAAPLEALSGA